MSNFRFTARDAQGQAQSGQIEAATAEAARQMLRERGLVVENIAEASGARIVDADVVRTDFAAPLSGTARPLSAEDAEQLTHQVSRLSTAQLPLGDGLRAAAAETASRILAEMLRELADDVDRGRSLEQALDDRQQRLPAHVRGLVRAAQRTGQLGRALFQVVDYRHRQRALQMEIFSAFAYPAVVVAMACLLLFAMTVTIVPTFEQMFQEFELKLPQVTIGLFWFRHHGGWVLLAFAVTLLVTALLARSCLGSPRWYRLLWSLPLIGEFWQWSAVVEFSRLVGLLVSHGVPLPEAFWLAGDAARDGYVRQTCEMLAAGAEQGRDTASMLHVLNRLPSSLTPLIRAGERTGTLPEAFEMAAELFEDRIRGRASMLRAVLPPFVFIGVGIAVMFAVLALFAPLFNLISSLSGG